MAGQSHTAGPLAKVRVHLTNPESGYESETEARVSASDWAVIDAVLCGHGQTYAAAPELLEALTGLLRCEDDASSSAAFGLMDCIDNSGRYYQSADLAARIAEARAAIAKATGEGA